MTEAEVVFELKGYWHTGSGTGSGASLDALVLRCENGLPYIPGRTVKGLLREACQLAEDFAQLQDLDFEGSPTKRLYGDSGSEDGDRFGTTAGVLGFNNATLGEEFSAWATTAKGQLLCRQLFRELSSTALGKDGQAKKNSLRRIEVAVPVTLKARVSLLQDLRGDWLQVLKATAPLVRRLGSQRNRGFGRAAVRVQEVSG